MVHNVWNNKESTVATAGTEITFHKTIGTDTATDKYLDFELNSTIRALIINPDKNVSMISINDEEADNALTIIGNKGFTRSGDSLLNTWSKIKIRTLENNTKLTVTVFIL